MCITIIIINNRRYLGDMSVVIDGNRAVIEGTETLCGCIASMDYCVKQFLFASGCSIEKALLAASYHPALVSIPS